MLKSFFTESTQETASTGLATHPCLFKPETKASLPKKILVVDDTLLIRKQIVRLLNMKGFECEQAEDGSQAIEAVKAAAARAESFALILMDLQMPVMNGQTATLALRNAGDTTPIICMSTLVNNPTELAQLTTGMNGYLPKQPIKQSDLALLLKEYLGSVTPTMQSAADMPSPTPSPMRTDSAVEVVPMKLSPT